MARRITEIQEEMLQRMKDDTTLSELTSRSATALYRLIAYVVASSIWILETLFEAHTKEVGHLIAVQKPHTLRWYVNAAKAFQYGASLQDSGDYDNTGLTEEEVVAQKIVAAAAAVEQNGRVFIKAVARFNANGVLKPLEKIEYQALKIYINEVKDAGVHIELISREADRLKLKIDVYYSPLVLSPTGARLDGQEDDPVKKAILTFLNTIAFNGLFVKSRLVDALQLVEGVVVPEVRHCEAARSDVLTWQPVDVFYQPYAGYLRFYDDNDLIVNYLSV